MKEELRDINKRLEEVKELLNKVYNKERDDDKTLIDFMKPTLKDVVLHNIIRKLKNVYFDIFDDGSYSSDELKIFNQRIITQIISEINHMNIEELLMTTDINGKYEWHDAALDLCMKGKMLDAVKLVKTMSGWGLKESKDYCDNLMER